MPSSVEYILANLQFKHLPAFASYIQKNKLHEFAQYQLQLSKELNLPLLKFFDWMSEEELIEISKIESNSILAFLAENNAKEFIESSVERWVQNQLPVVGKDNIDTGDVSLIFYIRKMSFHKLIPGYVSDLTTAMELIEEIEKLTLEQQSNSIKIFIELLNKKLNEHVHFIERIAETTPGIIYVYDLFEKKQVYSNNKLQELLGYSNEEVLKSEGNFLDKIMDPDDLEEGANYLKTFNDVKDGEIRSFKYRVKNKNGNYQWLRNYESVFKRNDRGEPYQVIGIALDVDKEKKAAEQLKQREEQLLEAQEIANLGSFTWNITENKTTGTPQLLEILELKENESIINFLHKVNRKDKKVVKEAVEKAMQEKESFECEFKYETSGGSKMILLKGIVEEGIDICMKGTVMDISHQHSLLQQIQQSEKLYKQAQTLTHIGNWTWDIKKNIVTWSDELFRIHDLEPQSEDISFEKVLSFIHKEDQQSFVNYVSNSLQKKEPYNVYYRITLGDGVTKYVNGKAEVILDENGEAEFLFGTGQDVTEQYITRLLLEENQRYVEKITDSAPLIMIAYNVQTHKYNFVSKAMQSILGYDRQQVLREGSTLFRKIIHPDDIVQLHAKITAAIEYANQNKAVDEKDTIIEVTYRVKHINGQYKYVQTLGTVLDRDESGRVDHMLHITMDITEKVEAEQKIKEQQHFIKHIADASPTILYVFDLYSEEVIYVNQEISPVLNYTPEQIKALGNKFFESLFHPDEFDKIAIEHKKLVDGNDYLKGIEYEVRMRHRTKGWRNVLLKEIIFNRDEETGQVKQVLCAVLDITELKTIEKALYEKTLELHQSNKSLEEFAYVASHDLKEPLRKISAFGDRLIASQKDKLDTNGQFFLNKIIDSSRRMNTMIDDLLSLSMLSNEREYENCSLQVILEEVLQTLEFKIEKRKAIILADVLPTLKIVPSQFRQLFQNLLSNAIKFVEEDTQPVIKIVCKFLTPAEVVGLDRTKATRFIQLQFIDNGIGFEQEYAERIFVVFQRLHGKSEYDGTGIGLAICKKVAENHGGIIYANSNPGEGATFTVVLPA